METGIRSDINESKDLEKEMTFNDYVNFLMNKKGYSEQEAILIAGCKLPSNQNTPVYKQVNEIPEK